jgi:hypothetical protein
LEPFRLNEDLARAWLTELIIRWEVGETLDTDGAAWRPQDPPIGLAWAPHDPGQEDTVFLLVRAAQGSDYATGPQGASVGFEYIDDGDDGVYRWLLDIASPKPLTLATQPAAMAALGEAGALGIEAALAVLQEAVQAANLLVQQLSDYITARKPPGHGD